ncbi:nucleotidyltransferase domain-containing protein [Hydrogenimonas sp. SS33]|uniref:nucleotidyltransferase family protein n=1 Tax=Hydrogenimonas leucolamina TaxID=2954236 RepID=UPI00336BBA47
MNREAFEKFLDEALECIKTFDVDKIILFGSYASGRADEESDADIFILKKELPPRQIQHYRRKIEKKLIPMQRKYKIGIDLLVDNEENAKIRLEKIGDQFYEEIFSKGKILYAQ